MTRTELPYKAIRRRRLIEHYVQLEHARILEIGALDDPTYEPEERDIKFTDWYTREEIVAYTSGNEHRNMDRVCEVHYPVKTKHFSQGIPDRFDLIIANHVIEHIPDVITWLQEIENCLRPGGYAFFAIPDKRFTFDILRRETNFTDLLRAYRADLDKPTTDQIFDAIYYKRPLTLADFVENTYQDKLASRRYTVNQAIDKAAEMAKEFVSLHCSVFSHPTFEALHADMTESGLVRMDIVKTQDVLADANEFLVLLRNP